MLISPLLNFPVAIQNLSDVGYLVQTALAVAVDSQVLFLIGLISESLLTVIKK